MAKISGEELAIIAWIESSLDRSPLQLTERKTGAELVHNGMTVSGSGVCDVTVVQIK